jgi:hypothetical protein
MRVPAIIQSGWWVAAAAIVISLLTAWFAVAPLTDRRAVGSPDSDFVFDQVSVPSDLVVQAMARDGVRVLSAPSTMTPAEVDRWNEEERGKLLVPGDRVIGVALGGEARAYPLRLMRWHEVVNDVVGGEPIAVTYSPLCDSVVVFSTVVDNEIIDLGVSGYLYNSNTLLYDRRRQPAASPLWTQLDGKVVTESGQGSISPLPLRVSALATWAEWRKRHPNTRVLKPEPDLKRLYKRDPYHSYFGSDLLHFPVRPLPPEDSPQLKDRVVVLTVDGRDHVFTLRGLASITGSDEGEVEVEVGALPVRVDFGVVPGTAIVDSPDDPTRLEAVRHTFWFAWYALERTIPDNIHATGSGDTPLDNGPTTTTTPGGA